MMWLSVCCVQSKTHGEAAFFVSLHSCYKGKREAINRGKVPILWIGSITFLKNSMVIPWYPFVLYTLKNHMNLELTQ